MRWPHVVPVMVGAALVISGGLSGSATAGTGAGAGVAATTPPADQAEADAAQELIRPVPASALSPALEPVDTGPPADPETVADRVAEELDNPWIEGALSVDIRDAMTGDALVQQRINEPVTPASLTKIVAAAAVVREFPMDERFLTRVVTGPEPGDIVLVAGGDSLLATGAGNPDAVVGHAGLADLADQVAATLAVPEVSELASSDHGDLTDAPTDGPTDTDPPRVRLLLDTSFVAGSAVTDGWTDYWVEQGFTGRITMLGLVSDRAQAWYPSPRDPALSTARAFAEALIERGIEVEGLSPEPQSEGGQNSDGQDDVNGQDEAEPEPLEVPRLSDLDLDPVDVDDPEIVVLGLVASAPAREVLAQALLDSDNSLTEQVVRIAADRAGVGTDPEAIATWLTEQIAAYGIDIDGMELENGSGLSMDTLIPARVVTDILVLAAGDDHRELREMITRLPVAGYTGTLRERFHLEVHDPGVGLARAKTGSLPGVTALAGSVITGDGRVLVFTLIADDVGADAAVLESRSALDEIVTELARCGC